MPARPQPQRAPREEVIDGGLRTHVVVSLHEIETEDGVPLIMTRRRAPALDGNAPPILLVHGLGQNRYSWHLPSRSLANYLVDCGFDVFIIELRGHGLSRTHGSPYPLRFEEYVDYDVPAAIEAVLELSGHDRTFYAGHSFGGTIGYCLTPVQEQLAGVISIGGPGLFGAGNRALQAFGWLVRALDRYTPLRFVPYAAFPAEPFALALKALMFYLDRPNRFPLRLWEPGSIDRDILYERLTRGFDRTGRGVIRQTYHWGTTQTFTCPDSGEDYTDRLAGFAQPLLFIQGDNDFVVPYDSIRICVDTVASDDVEVRTFNAEETGHHWGHLDLVFGDHAPEHVWPYLTDWMRARTHHTTVSRRRESTRRTSRPPADPAPDRGSAAGDEDDAFIGATR